MKILVQKFGGTSVSTHEKRMNVIEKIKNALENDFLPVVVVSAMGRKGEPYATDTLLSLIENEFRYTNKLATDLLMSCGEVISTVVMCNELNKFNINTVPFTGGQAGIITDDINGNASVINIDTSKILEALNENKVPVVAGFQGISKNGFITTLGRGGSDVTASLLGVALKAEKIEIYTDVDGIMTADPKIVEDASLIEEISYSEVFQFADQGAKVIHPRAVEIAMRANIPLIIKNTMSDCYGTVINSTGNENTNNIITGITYMNDRTQIKVSYNQSEAYNNLFDVLADNKISLDLINVFPKEKIFTIDGKDTDTFDNIMSSLNLPYEKVENCSKIAVIGSGMRGIPGVMAKILKALTRENIEVLQTADSHMTIWCLVRSNLVKKSLNALHKEFKLS